jgi:hypothetical protein
MLFYLQLISRIVIFCSLEILSSLWIFSEESITYHKRRIKKEEETSLFLLQQFNLLLFIILHLNTDTQNATKMQHRQHKLQNFYIIYSHKTWID